MKNIIVITLFFTFLSGLHAQKLENQLRLNIELDMVQPIFGGIGGSIGVENNHLGYGIMAFQTPLKPRFRDVILKQAENYRVLNWGVETYVDYYFNSKHKGIYAGALLSLDGYKMKNEIQPQETILGLYLVPRIGYRLVMFKKLDWLYLQPSLAVPILIWDSASNFKHADISLSRTLILPMFTLGIRVNLYSVK